MKNLKKYFQGNLTEQEMENFTQQLIQQKFDQDTKKEWQEALAKKHGVNRDPKKSRRPKLRFLSSPLMLAASIILLLGAVWTFKYFQPVSVQSLAIEHTSTLPVMADQLMFRKGDNDLNDIRLRANEAFAERNYRLAIQYWEQIGSELQSVDYFYLGTAYLVKGQPDFPKAIDYLNKASENPNTFEHEINWTLAIALLRNNQPEAAKSVLQEIISNKKFMVKEAQQLLDAIS